MATESVEKCENCGHVIATNESPFLWLDRVVCAPCRAKLETGVAATPVRPVLARVKEAYRRRPVFMAIASGVAAAVLVSLVVVAATWMFWASSKTLHGIDAGLRSFGKAAALVLPTAHGAIHGRIWWRSTSGAVRLGRDKTVVLVRRRTSGAAFQAQLRGSGAYAALILLASHAARLRVAYRKAQAAYGKARAAYNSARAAYGPGMRWTSSDGAKATADINTRAAYKSAKAAYGGPLAAKEILDAHFPKRIGFASASGICNLTNVHIPLRKLFGVKKTKANFKGQYHFSKVAAGKYFLLCRLPPWITINGITINRSIVFVHYKQPIQVSAGQDADVDVNLNKGPGGVSGLGLGRFFGKN